MIFVTARSCRSIQIFIYCSLFMFFFILFAWFFFMSFFLLSEQILEQIFRGTEIFSFFDQSKRGFKFLLKHDWLKKVKFVINRALNFEHFVNKFHSPSLIIFFIVFALYIYILLKHLKKVHRLLQ